MKLLLGLLVGISLCAAALSYQSDEARKVVSENAETALDAASDLGSVAKEKIHELTKDELVGN